MFNTVRELSVLTLGEQFNFLSNANLPAITANENFTGYWQNIGNGTIERPRGNYVLTSEQLMNTFNGSTMADTFVWQPVSRPIFTVREEVILNTGEEFNPMNGVSAEDYIDGNITSLITYVSTVDINTAGTYYVTYTVTNIIGVTTTFTKRVIVNDSSTEDDNNENNMNFENNEEDEDANVPDTLATISPIIYVAGLLFVFGGVGIMLYNSKKRKEKIEII